GEAELLQPLGSGSASTRVRVHDELRARGERLGRDRVEVADDQVGPMTRLEQRVGTAVDGDEHRTHLARVRPQRRQVLAVIEAAYHHADLPVLDPRAQL